MRVAFDATPLLGKRSGVGTWCREVVTRLATQDDLDLVAYVLSWRGRADPLELPRTVRVASKPMAAGPLLRAWSAIDHPRIERWTGRVDVVLGTNYVTPPTKGGALAVVYDAGPWVDRDQVVADARRFPEIVARQIDRGAHVLTISAAMGEQLADLLHLERSRLHWAHLAPAPGPVGRAEEGVRTAGSDRYIVALGTEDRRKGLDVLVDAFGRLAPDHPDLRLVMAGDRGSASEALDATIATSGAADRIVRTGWVDDQGRADLLAGAAVLAYPSRHEGFGLPPLEAMVAGVPVVATAAGAIPEVVGEAAVLVPLEDAQALADAIAMVLRDSARRDRLVARGRHQAARYSWDATADSVRRALEAAAR